MAPFIRHADIIPEVSHPSQLHLGHISSPWIQQQGDNVDVCLCVLVCTPVGVCVTLADCPVSAFDHLLTRDEV